MKSYFYIHIPFFIIPVLFIFFTSLKISHHWNDGTEGSRYYATQTILKTLACLFISALEVLHVIINSPADSYPENEKLFRLTYYVVFSFSWLLSAYLVYFEYKRRIKPSWLGQRGFWVLSCLASLTILIMNILDQHIMVNPESTDKYFLYQTIISCFSIAAGFFLTFTAFFKPNDFFIDKLLSKQTIENLENYPEHDPKLLKASVSGYKVKTLNNTQTAYFEIIVSIDEYSNKVSRTFQEFEKLHNQLEEKLLNEFNSFEPAPKQLINSSIEARLAGLNEYLSKICSERIYTQELLNFLHVPSRLQEELKGQYHRHDVSSSNIRLRTSSELHNYFSLKPISNDTSTMSHPVYHLNWIIDIQIPSWTRVDKHIEYSIKTEIQILSFESIVTSRFSEIENLHKALAKFRIPVPDFPSKSLSSLTNDSDAISNRKSQLEIYLGKVFNDPAYLHSISLKFINCNLEVDKILAGIPKARRYELVQPLRWKGEIGNDSSQYIVYVMKFNKFAIGKSQHWEVTRRFRQFVDLHKNLQHRHSSFLLEVFLKSLPSPLPQLPSQTLSPLCTCEEIESRKLALEAYIQELIKNNAVTCSYEFRVFIGEVD